MSIENYLVGEVAHITVALTTPDLTPVDPGAVRLKVKSPAGTLTTLTVTVGQIVKASVGNYGADVLLNEVGSWRYRWEADAPNAGAAEGVMMVRKSVVI